MKYKIFSMLSATVLLISSVSADSLILATAGVGQSNYEFEDYSSFSYPFLDLGLNIGIEHIYMSLNANIPLSDADSSKYDKGFVTQRDDTMSRYQYSANIGYRFDMGIAVFTGINYADSNIDTFYKNLSLDVTTKMKETGYHLGLAGSLYTWEGVGAINIKAAYSITNLDLDISYSDGRKTFSKAYDGTGYLFGLGWFGVITQNWTYYLNVDGYRYSYDIDGDNYDSNQLSYKAGLGYIF
jgi:hypothetical protein